MSSSDDLPAPFCPTIAEIQMWSEKKSGAGLCFDSMWLPEFFPEKLRQIPQDADRLTALYEGLVSQNRAVKIKLQSPFYHEKPKPGIVRKLHSFGRQCLTWTFNCSKMAFRQKTFARFVGLSFLCVLMSVYQSYRVSTHALTSYRLY